jgi:uncharacterized protein YyaL (SSP411 family)
LNPVDWYPWGKEAFAKARNDNKPIFLSVGYSTCHWCHQLAKESFEDEKVAAYINKNFIPIKVDREERPEVDAYYMGAVQAMTGGGGWPLSVFLTPDLKPFYGGTYFPPEPRYGMPSLMQVFEFVSNLWKEKREEVLASSEGIQRALMAQQARGATKLGTQVLEDGYSALVASLDPVNGGFGTAPKFPLPNSLGFLLRYNYRTGKDLALTGVTKTLDGIMAGGIRDHVGGGFHRYSTDRVWLVPHFEKMLYDNALLAKVFAEAFQVTGNPAYAEVVRETLGWIAGEMRDKAGGFYSAQDADTSEGEGIYYTWTFDEIIAVLGADEGAAFCRLFGVTKNGNFEGRTILHLDRAHGPTEQEQRPIARAKRLLYTSRVKRLRPATDGKVLTSWNGLAISAFAFSGLVLGDSNLVRVAESAAEFVLSKNAKEGRLLRRYAGGEAALEGTLEDYAFFVQGLLDLFEATGEPRWLQEAIRLTQIMISDYEDKQDGGFYFTAAPDPARLKEAYDGPTPSGNSVAALNLIRLSELTGNQGFREAAERTLEGFGKDVEENPASHTVMLTALDLLRNGVREIVVSAQSPADAAAMKDEAFRPFLPDKAVMVATSSTYAQLSKLSELLEGRRPAAKPRAFVCQNFACKLPADSVEALRGQLASR